MRERRRRSALQLRTLTFCFMALWGFPVVLKVNTQLTLENEREINQGMVMTEVKQQRERLIKEGKLEELLP